MNHSDDAAAASWPELYGGMRGYSHVSVTQNIHQDLMSAPQHLSTAGPSLPNFYPAIDTSFMPTHTTLMAPYPNQINHTYPGVPDAWPMLTQTLFDGSSFPTQPLGNYQWTGMAPLAPYSTVTTPNVVGSGSSTIPSLYQDEPAWLSRQGQSMYYMSPSSSGSGSEVGLGAPEYSANVSGLPAYPVNWATNEMALSLPTATSAPTLPTFKRCREEGLSDSDEGRVVIDTQDMPPQKRARCETSNGIPKAKGSAARIRHKPAAKVPKSRIIDVSKEAGRGAEKPANPNSQGVHRQPSSGPSIQQGWVTEAPDGQMIWVAGSAKGVASTAQEQPEEAKGEHFLRIPKTFKAGHKALLVATQADWDRGAIQDIKCRLCPDTRLKTWEDFKRHCDTMEAHPLKIAFCNFCGDFFARVDSLERHCKNRPPECRDATPENASAKRVETQKAHVEFTERLEVFLRTGEGIGKPFSQIIKDMYPGSSKKRTGAKKERNRFKGC